MAGLSQLRALEAQASNLGSIPSNSLPFPLPYNQPGHLVTSYSLICQARNHLSVTCTSTQRSTSYPPQIPDSGGLVLEEQPQKVAHALQLFLQGMGHAATLGIQPTKSVSEQLQLQGVAISREEEGY